MVVQNHSRLRSLSNSVHRASNLGRSVIAKQYASRGRKNGYELPLTRISVEVLMLESFQRFISTERDSLLVPRALGYDHVNFRLYMTDLGGVALDEGPDVCFPCPEKFAALGRVCGMLERTSEELAQRLRRNVWVAQDTLRRRVVDRRIRGVTPEQTSMTAELISQEASPSTICLGDLCLANLLACDGRLGIVDFEFAHIGHAGRDVGRLVAQLNTKANRDQGTRTSSISCSEALLVGFANAGGDLCCAQRWAEVLNHYYSPPDNPKGLFSLS